MKYFLFFFLFSYSLYAQVYQRYCFSNQADAQDALKKLNFIKINDDKIELDFNCLDLLIQHHRTDLFQKFIQFRMPHAKIQFGSNMTSKDECHILVEVEKNKQNQNQQFQIYNDLIVNETHAIQNQNEQYSLLVSSGKSGVIQINEHQINVTCFKNADWYEVKLNVLNQGPGIQIQNELLVQRGQRIQIGSIDQNQKNQKQDIGLNRLHYQNFQDTLLQSIYLKIK
jgi:hypothetical protein